MIASDEKQEPKEVIVGRNLINTVKNLLNKTVPKKLAEEKGAFHSSDLQFLS